MRGEAEIRRECEMWALVAELQAARADMEQMAAANAQRALESSSPAYGEEAFRRVTCECLSIAARLRGL